MSLNPQDHISLIDLSKQFPFEIDDELKNELCFEETLVVSCAHCKGDVEGAGSDSDSDWTCYESEETPDVEETKKEQRIELKDFVVEEEEMKQESDGENDFHFYFFRDCAKPLPPKNSLESVTLVDGFPKVNLEAKAHLYCLCGKDKRGRCACHSKLPCKCGAKKHYECICGKLLEICVCNEIKPEVKCTCAGSKVCVCFPDSLPQAKCICGQVEKPCICDPEKFPFPVCPCKHKPIFNFGTNKMYDEVDTEMQESESEITEGTYGETVTDEIKTFKSETVLEEGELEPCICQMPETKKPCLCKKEKECTCNEDACICGVQKSCVCEPTRDSDTIICKSESNKSFCSCPVPRECIGDVKPTDCQCFPKQTVCTCGSPEDCKCFKICECTDPCVCDILLEKQQECICSDKEKLAEKKLDCTCIFKDKEPKKLKRVRAKHGYRWCHDVDPYHTYFDFMYGQHDKVDYKLPEKENVEILGLHDSKRDDETCHVHGVQVPEFKKKVTKPSLDCCSTVGGISVSVETLGEDKDKFLVQVVSHTSKEGAKTGSKLVSILDSNLHTMEENRIEYNTKKDLTKERRSYITICDKGYYNKVSRICGDRYVVKRFYHTFEQASQFLLEGANVVLLRYFGLRRYKGTVKTKTIMMDGTICESIYSCPGVSQAIVNNQPLFVVKVERHILEPSGVVHQSMTVLSLRGYMISHEWADNSYVIHLNPLLRVDPAKDKIEQHAALRDNWRQDLQLLSDYLDFKSIRSSEGTRYMNESGALTSTVRDYLQAILLLKPQDVLHFTRHYFSTTLSSLDLPHDDYFDSCPKRVRYFFFE